MTEITRTHPRFFCVYLLLVISTICTANAIPSRRGYGRESHVETASALCIVGTHWEHVSGKPQVAQRVVDVNNMYEVDVHARRLLETQPSENTAKVDKHAQKSPEARDSANTTDTSQMPLGDGNEVGNRAAGTITCSFNISAASASISCSSTVLLSVNGFNKALELGGVERMTKVTKQCSFDDVQVLSVLTLCSNSAADLILRNSRIEGNFSDAPHEQIPITNILSVVSTGGSVKLQDSTIGDVSGVTQISAILLSGQSVSVSNSKFKGNIRGLHIVLQQSPKGEESTHKGALNDLEFLDHVVKHTDGYELSSGALVVEALVGQYQPLPPFRADVELNRVTFRNNSALYSGSAGAAHFYFKNNIAGVYNIAMTDTEVDGNYARVGGAIAVDFGGSNDTTVLFTTSNTTFSANTAIMGGAIQANNSGSRNLDFRFVMVDTKFHSNQAIFDFHAWSYEDPHPLNGSGGGVLFVGSDCSYYNPFTAPASTSKQRFCKANCTLTVNATNTEFFNNTATHGGGGIRLDAAVGLRSDVNIIVDNLTMTENMANALTLGETLSDLGYGGALVAEVGRGYMSNVTLSGTRLVLDSNKGDFGAGMCLQADANSHNGSIDVRLTELLAVNNFGGFGGAMALISADSYNMTIDTNVVNLTLVGNMADTLGGAIYIDASNSTSKVRIRGQESSCVIRDTAAGGAITVLHAPVATGNSSTLISGCSLANNTAGFSSGGAVYVLGQPEGSCNSASNQRKCWKPTLELNRLNISDCVAKNGNGGAVSIGNAIAHISNVNFVGNKAHLSGGAVYAQGSQTIITNASFVGNKAGLQGGAVYGSVGDAQDSNSMVFTNSMLTKNSASREGGAIFLRAGTAELQNCIIKANAANYRGGAIYFANICGKDDTDCYVSSDAETRIANNTAEAGGAVFLELPAGSNLAEKLLNLSKSTGSNGTKFGPDVLLAPDESALLMLSHDGTDQNSSVWASTLGARGQVPLRVQAGNQSGIRVQVEVESGSVGANAVYLTEFTQSTDDEGVATFTDLHLVGGSMLMHRQATGEAGKHPLVQSFTLRVSTPDWQHVRRQNASVTIRGCVIGEAFRSLRQDLPMSTIDSQAVAYVGTCDVCVTGSYAVIGPGVNGSCDPCPVGNTANCSEGVITPRKGYWQGAVGSDIIQACPHTAACQGNRTTVQTGIAGCVSPSDNSSCTLSCQQYTSCVSDCLPSNLTCWDDCSRLGSCLSQCAGGGPCADRGYSNMLCSDGYEGYLCGSCQAGYGAYKLLKCGKCLGEMRTWAVYVFVVLVISSIVVFIACTVINAMIEADSDSLTVSEVFKVLTTHIQMLSVISSLLVDWPPAVTTLLSSLNFLQGPAESRVLSLDCLGLSLTSGGKLWASLAFPFIVSIVSMSILFILKTIPRCVPHKLPRSLKFVISCGGAFSTETWNIVKMRHLVFITTMVSVFFLYTTLVSTAFTPLTCIMVDYTAQPHWAFNMDVQCWSLEHLQAGFAPGLLGILLLCVVVPMFNFITSKKVGTIDDHVTSHALTDFLFRQYREGMYTWELYAVLHQGAMVAVGLFGKRLGAYYQLLLLMLLLITNSSLTHIFHPFRKLVVHILHLASITLMLLTCTAILALKDADRIFTPAIRNSEDFTTFQISVSVLVALFHVFFVLWCVFLLAVVQALRKVRPHSVAAAQDTAHDGFHAVVLKAAKVASRLMRCKELEQNMHFSRHTEQSALLRGPPPPITSDWMGL